MLEHAKSASKPVTQGRQGAAPIAAGAGLSSAVSAQQLRIAQMQKALGNQAMSRYLIQRNTASPPASQTTPQPGTTSNAPQGAPANQPPAHGDPRLPEELPKPRKVAMRSIMGAHLRSFTSVPGGGAGPDKYQVEEANKVGEKIKYKGEVEIYSSIRDATGNWVLAKQGGQFGFVREDKVLRGLERARNVMAKQVEGKNADGKQKTVEDLVKGQQEEGSALEDLADSTGVGLEFLGMGPGEAGDALDNRIEDLEDKGGQEGKIAALEKANAGLGFGTYPIDLAAGALGGIVGMKKTLSAVTDGGKSADERFFEGGEGVLDTAKAVQEGVESTAGFADNIDTVRGTESAAGAVGDWAGSVGDAIKAVKSAFFLVKDVYDMFKKAFSAEGIGKDEIISGSLSAISNGLQVAQSAVKTVKSILDIMKVGASALGHAIPGIGIAISGIQITIKVYGMIKSAVSAYKMTKIKRKFKEDYAQGGYVRKKKYQVFGKTLFTGRNAGVDTEELGKRKATLENKSDDASAKEKKDIQEYELAREMKSINVKRLTRSSIQVGLEMVNIAGDIATLSGVGAEAGMPLKAVAAGASVTMSVARMAKQFGRDRAAKSSNRVLNTIFDKSKSSDEKKKKRGNDAKVILQMIADLPDFEPGNDAVAAQYQRVEDFISACGINPRELYRLNGKPIEQRELLMEAMKKRE
ncbi:hypothetical protein MO973_31100 [Paenibacillus sp. TRM 82003]|nr:hypothetical protein [Paenibacillus sp. TRM 82003]